MGVHLALGTRCLAGTIAFVLLGAIYFPTISLMIAALVRTRERVQGLGQLILMPLFFASNALYPVDHHATYVAAIAAFNPLSYMVDGAAQPR